MKFFAFFLSLFLLACNNDQAEKALLKSAGTRPAVKATSKKTGITIPVIKYGIEGFYTGDFLATQYDETKEAYGNKITICIDSLSEMMVYGHSVVAGNDRPFSGGFKKRNNEYLITVKEPGDDKYDGVFDFILDSKTKELKGSWVSNNQKLAVTGRKYELKQQPYKYDPSLNLPEEIVGAIQHGSFDKKSDMMETLTEDVLKNNASTTVLKSKDIENMYKSDLEILRNSIYARHGYSFKNLKMRALFDNYIPWYMPVSTDVTALLTDIEKKNIELIKRYEQHATRYYDDFGR